MSCSCEEEGDGSGETGNVVSTFRMARNLEPSAEIEDPFCSPKNPKKITYEQIRNARKALESGIEKTPLSKSRLSEKVGMNIYLKKEFLQQTGSFKDRGAKYALMNLPEDKKRVGAVSASCGNHAMAMAYYGQNLGIPVTVVMPVTVPLTKIQRCKELNAKVVIEGENLEASAQYALNLAKQSGAVYINGYDHPDVLAAQGTIGVEILEDLPTTNAVVVPVGGGGLLAGIAVAIKTLKPCTKVIGVETESCIGFANCLKAGKVIVADAPSTLADGLAVPISGYNAFTTAQGLVDRMITVNEDDIAVSILRLIEHEKMVVEGAAAASLAAVLSGQLSDFRGKNVVLLLSGGNIDSTILGRCIERGLASEGRLVKFYVTVTDRPGSISELSKLIASVGVTMRRIEQERAWILTDIFSMRVKVICETRDFDHSLELEKILNDHYKEVAMVHADFPPSSNAKP